MTIHLKPKFLQSMPMSVIALLLVIVMGMVFVVLLEVDSMNYWTKIIQYYQQEEISILEQLIIFSMAY